jgi:hypothetical protein
MKLSDKHMSKVLDEDNPVKKRILYLKYFHTDSIKHAKTVKSYWQSKYDSSFRGITKKTKALRSFPEQGIAHTDNLTKQLHARVALNPETYRMPAQLEGRYTTRQVEVIYGMAKQFLIEASKDSTNRFPGFNFKQYAEVTDISRATDFGKRKLPKYSLQKLSIKDKRLLAAANKKNAALGQLNTLKGQVNEYTGEFQKYNDYSNLSADSAKQLALSFAEKEFSSRIMEVDAAKGFQSEMTQFTAMQSKYKSQLADLNDSTARKEMLKQQAEKLAMDYIQDNPGILQDVQKKVSLLMKKYSSVANSNDLSSAVKRTSLNGKTFGERLVLAANFQLLTLDPVSIDFSPQVGYKFNSRLALGVGGTYRQTFTNTSVSFAPDVFGYKGFVSYEVISSFFAYGEYGRNSPGLEVAEGTSQRIWKDALFVGAGRRFSIHKKVDMTVTALYNFMHETGDPIYPRPFVVRFGFQLSELALLKKKPELKLIGK